MARRSPICFILGMSITAFKRLQKRYDPRVERDQDHDILSHNKVTGFSVNFPIASTCQPSKVCAETCYGLTGPISWSASLAKHARNLEWAKASPEGFADKLEKECRKLLAKDPLFFLRWNGVGDLFPESTEALLSLNEKIPELPIWCVTRIPGQIQPLLDKPNIWVHFSLDGDSLDRKEKVDALYKSPSNLFFSFQVDKNQSLETVPAGVSVLFFDKYKLQGSNERFRKSAATCPLNTATDISNMCHQCRRCFNGEAVKMKLES